MWRQRPRQRAFAHALGAALLSLAVLGCDKDPVTPSNRFVHTGELDIGEAAGVNVIVRE